MHVLGTINLLCNSFIKIVEFLRMDYYFFKKQLFQGAKLEYTCFYVFVCKAHFAKYFEV